jgi:hypothetical protein
VHEGLRTTPAGIGQTGSERESEAGGVRFPQKSCDAGASPRNREIGIALRDKPTPGYCWQDNELYDVYQPIIGTLATHVYANLSRKAYGAEVRYSLSLVKTWSRLSRSSVWRALGILELIGMVRLRSRGGNQESVCELIDLKELAKYHGAKWNKQTASYALSNEIADELRAKVEALQNDRSGKKLADGELNHAAAKEAFSNEGRIVLLPVSQRDASVSPERHQRSTRETEARPHLLLQDTRIQDTPSPTPSHEPETPIPKYLSNEDEKLLQCARTLFTGLIDDLRAHLLDTSKPPHPNLANGFADWQNFGFNSLAVEAATKRGNVLVLSLSAFDPAAAQRGLEKYRRKWEASIREWFGCKVQIIFQSQRPNDGSG